MFAVCGASGHTGKPLADSLLKAGKKVRVLGRRAEGLQEFVKSGAEAVTGELDDAAFLAKAFAGTECAYVMIPFLPTAPDYRAYQNRISAAAADAVRRSGVRKVVTLGSVGADAASGNGLIQGLYDQEQIFNALPEVDVLHLSPTFFFENLLANISVIKSMGFAGSALRGDVAWPMIATADIGRYAAGRILKLDWSGKSVQPLLGAADYRLDQATKVLGATIGKPDLDYVQFPYDDAENAIVGMGWSADAAHRYIEMTRFFNDGKINLPARNPGNTTPTTLTQFAPVFAAAYNAS